MKRNKIKIFLVIYIFMFIYSPAIVNIGTQHIMAMIAYLIIILNKKKIEYICKSRVMLIYFISVLTIIGYLYFTGLFQPHTSLLKGYPQIVILFEIIPIAFSIVLILRAKEYTINDFMKLILVVGTIQGIIAIIAFFNSDFQQMIVQHMMNMGYSKAGMMSRHRLYGFSLGLTYAMPIVQGLLMIISLYMAGTVSIKYLYFAPILCVSAVINARSSIVIMIWGVVFLVLYFIFIARKIKISVCIRYIMIICLVSLLIPVILGELEQISPETYVWIEEGIKEIQQLIRGEEVGYFTYVTNENRLNIPDDIGVLFGKGYYVMGGSPSGMYSDIGFINDLWFGGIIYSIGTYGIITYILIRVYKFKLYNTNINKFIPVYLGGVLILANIKGIVIGNNEIMSVCTLIIVYILCNSKKGVSSKREQLKGINNED